MSRIKNLFRLSTRGCLINVVIVIALFFLAVYLLSYDKQPDQAADMVILLADGTPAATLAPGESPLPTVTPFALSTPASPLCQPGIEIGKTINVVYPKVRMRYSSGYVSKNDVTDTKHYLQTGDRVTVVNGPEINDELCWWYVQHQNWQGWTADHSHTGRLLLSAGP